jgi:hypothetical protein
MTHFVFEDGTGKPCAIFDLKFLQVVYPQWDFKESLDKFFELVKSEILEVSKNHKKYEESEFKDKETKNFLINQSNNVLLHLKRLKRFLEEGIDKGYKLILDS